MRRDRILSSARAALGALALAFSAVAWPAATIVIINADGPGEGFNDPTPAAPVGGNPGTTIGQQRLNVFQAAANVWGATLTSLPTVAVYSNFDALSCNASSAVLGSAGPVTVWRDFPGALRPATWYHNALANKLANADLSTGDPAPINNAEIVARFNSNLGNAGCLTGTFFYYGLDNNHGPNIDLFTVVLHELGHGLGFSTVTSGSTGSYLAGFPSIYDAFTFDSTQNLLWTSMNDAQRQASAVNPRKVVWTGANVTAAVPGVLSAGTPFLTVTGSLAANGTYDVGTASFGPPIGSPGTTADIMPVVDQPNGTGLACNPLNLVNASAVRNNIALVDRGICTFATKVKNAQNAGAVGVIVVNNAAGAPPPGMGGSDPTITIPSAMVAQGDGTTIRNALKFRSRTRSGVIGNLGLNLAVRSGADALGRALLFTPNPFQGGSSVSHWDTIAFPNLLMEPAINADLTHSVIPPQDLTFKQLQDIGW